MEIRLVRDTVSRDELTEIAKRQFGHMVKAVVDMEQGIMAIGGELSSDEEVMLLDQGSVQRYLWELTSTPTSRWVSGSNSTR